MRTENRSTLPNSGGPCTRNGPSLRFLRHLATLLAILNGFTVTARAQGQIQWSAPQRIPGYPPDTYSPYLVADSNGGVHAFHSQPTNGTISVVYSRWDYEHGWTMPVDIFLPLRGEAQVKGAWLDTHGMTHLIFTNGNDQLGGDLFYSRAPALEAGSVRAWSAARLIGPSANLFAGAILGDDRGNLYVFYGGTLHGHGLYEVASHDNGETWSRPAPIHLTNDDAVFPGNVALLLDESHELHVSWAEWEPPNPRDLYYARLDVDSGFIAPPVHLDEGGSDTPVMIKHDGVLFLIYATSGIAHGVAGKAMKQSADAGRSWSNALWAFPPLVGGNGNAALVQDSNHTLYAFLGNRAGDCCHGLWYSTWHGNAWSDPQAIVQGPKSAEFDPFSPHAVISQGNVVLVTWWNESRINGVWYSSAKLNAPELPLLPLPTTVPNIVPFGSPAVWSPLRVRTVLLLVVSVLALCAMITMWRRRK